MKRFIMVLVLLILCGCAKETQTNSFDPEPYIQSIQNVTGLTEQEAVQAYRVLNECGIDVYTQISYEGSDEQGKFYYLDGVNAKDINISFNVDNDNVVDFVCIRLGRVLYSEYELIVTLEELGY